MKAFITTIKFGLVVIAICFIGIVIGCALQYLIPGCSCDAGAGCNGCNIFGGLISLLTMGGFVLMMLTIVFCIPTAILIGLISSSFGSNKNEQP